MELDPCCNVKMQDIVKLKASTKKLLGLLEEIQSNTYTREPKSAISEKAIFTQTYTSVKDDYDDCSAYKRLTRKCHCLNREEFNDFIIHFNEDTKHFTNNMGEIIKNTRILKKFLYIGGDYTNNALLFLNEALSEANHSEKLEIINGCSHADICNVFEEYTIVAIFIRLTHKFECFSDVITQGLTAQLLYKLAQVEEGRCYLNYSSKIQSDIKKVLRKKATKLDFDTLECLNAVLNLLLNTINENIQVTYYCGTKRGT